MPTIPNPTLVRTSAITRLGQVYRLLLEIAKCKTADGVEVANPEPSAPTPTITDGEM